MVEIAGAGVGNFAIFSYNDDNEGRFHLPKYTRIPVDINLYKLQNQPLSLRELCYRNI